MSTTERIVRVSVDDVRRTMSSAKHAGTSSSGRKRNNNRRQNRSFDSNDKDQKLVLRDRKLGIGPLKSKAGNRARDRDRGYPRERERVDLSPSRHRHFEQTPIWEYQQQDRMDRSQQSMSMTVPLKLMQVPINALTSMGQNQMNVPSYRIMPYDSFQQSNNLFIQQQQQLPQAQSSQNMQFSISSPPSLDNNCREQIEAELQKDRNIVMEAVRSRGTTRFSPEPTRFSPETTRFSPASYNKSVTYAYTGEPVGRDAIIHVPYCRVCSVYIPREKDVELHLKSEKHFRHCFDVLPEQLDKHDLQDNQRIEKHSRSHYDDVPLVRDSIERVDRLEQIQNSNRNVLLETGQDYFDDTRFDQEYDERNYRQQAVVTPTPPSRTIVESRQINRGGGSAEEHVNFDTLFGRPLLKNPSRPVQLDEDNHFEQEYAARYCDRSSPLPQQIDSLSSHHRNDHESSSRDYRRRVSASPPPRSLPSAPPPPILRPPPRQVSGERGKIEFNPPKVISRDWGKSGNKRGDYGQPFDVNERPRGSAGNSSYSNVTQQCSICGLKGSYDFRSHMEIAHQMHM